MNVPAGVTTENRYAAGREKIRRSQETADVCYVCGTELGSDAVVWRVRTYWGRATVLGYLVSTPIVSMCETHGKAAMLDKARWRGYSYPPANPKPCDACRRLVVDPYPRERRHTFCSRRCERDHRAALARERRRDARGRLVCPVCGKEFEPRRADARTCSNRCRQAAHRERRRELAEISADEVDV
jgi:predicted nucleic acid-binding Zn ribbon protein